MSAAGPRDRVVLVAPSGPDAQVLAAELERAWAVERATDLAAIRERLAAGAVAVVIDLETARLDGLDLVTRLHELEPLASLLVLAGPGDEDRASAALEGGADDALVRPFGMRRFGLVVARLARRHGLADRLRRSEADLAERFAADRIVGESRGLSRAREALRAAAQDPGQRVLLVGESGTGRQLFARVLHAAGPTPRGSFAVLAAHDPGPAAAAMAATDATDATDRGMLFVTGMESPSPRARALFAGPAPGGARPVRIAGAATAEPPGLDALGTRRIHLPPLREREGDVALLADHFLRHFNREHSRRVTGLTRGALAHLEAWDWPGNVRELRAVIEAMVVFAEARRPLDVSDLPLALRQRSFGERGNLTLSLETSLAEAEKCFLEEVLRSVGYDRARAAETLGIGLRTLYRKLKEYEIG